MNKFYEKFYDISQKSVISIFRTLDKARQIVYTVTIVLFITKDGFIDEKALYFD